MYFSNYLGKKKKYFEYQETKPSNKLAPAIFPEFPFVALSIVYTFHLTMFFQTGVYNEEVFACRYIKYRWVI